MQPNILRLQRRLFEQLANDESIPTKSSKSIEQQRAALAKVAKGKCTLIVLDDVWDALHQQHFDVIDHRIHCCFFGVRPLITIALVYESVSVQGRAQEMQAVC